MEIQFTTATTQVSVISYLNNQIVIQLVHNLKFYIQAKNINI